MGKGILVSPKGEPMGTGGKFEPPNRILGCPQEILNFYHAFLPHKAAVAEPLHRLLDKQASWEWGPRQAAAFHNIKGLLIANPVLAHFDETLPVILACNASPYGVGAVLAHRLPDGREVPVAYYSRTLSAAERNYAQIDREGLAIVAGVKKFHDFVYGRPFTIATDHKPLLGLFAPDRRTPQIISPRVLRWSIFLAAYDYKLEHRPGKAMGHADALSHLPLPEGVEDPAPVRLVLQLEELPEAPLQAADIARRSARDPIISRVLGWVVRGWPGKPEGPEVHSLPLPSHSLGRRPSEANLLPTSRLPRSPAPLPTHTSAVGKLLLSQVISGTGKAPGWVQAKVQSQQEVWQRPCGGTGALLGLQLFSR